MRHGTASKRLEEKLKIELGISGRALVLTPLSRAQGVSAHWGDDRCLRICSLIDPCIAALLYGFRQDRNHPHRALRPIARLLRNRALEEELVSLFIDPQYLAIFDNNGCYCLVVVLGE